MTEVVQNEKRIIDIDAKGMHYRTLNVMIKELADQGVDVINVHNVNGHRYIGTNSKSNVTINLYGVPGNDMATFMDGPNINVFANGQDSIGNTMNSGRIVIHGHAGDVIGYAMRGGKILIRDGVGYRVAIHMKEYKKQIPVIVAGGTAGDFFGEYMAGGILLLLGLNREDGKPLTGNYVATGMHGGVIYLRGDVEEYKLGKEVKLFDVDEDDMKQIEKLVKEYAEEFGGNAEEILNAKFTKLLPVSSRPYGKLYVY